MSCNYYLDSNICISYLRKPYGELSEKIFSVNPDNIKLPSIVKGELLVCAIKSNKPQENILQVLDFCRSFEIVPFDDSMVITYGKIRAELELKGQKIGANDTIIAATALARNGILVTNNVNEFARVSGLMIDDWTKK
ncbi:MAG: type II toxin-antitoxin system VapC family toxin [Synergistaceae bacterium]|nr:type II toxin-antitoxin system VapC family toxin [Synergistaceae bacterium]